jgi:hypothetical protein
MSHGGLPPRRPDQTGLPSPRGTAPGARIARIGGTPGGADQLNVNSQPATAFYTFAEAGRLFTAGLAFAVGSDASFTSTAVDQFYARLSTASGLVMCSIQLAICAPSDHDSDTDDWAGPDTGVPVAAGDQLVLDVNNGAPVAGGFGAMRADCSVIFTIP